MRRSGWPEKATRLLGALQGVIMIKAADGTQRTYTYETTAPKEEVDCVDYFKHPASWTRAAALRRRVTRGRDRRRALESGGVTVAGH